MLAIRAFRDITRTPKKRPQLWEAPQNIFYKKEEWGVPPLARGPVQRLACLMDLHGWSRGLTR